jgi:hypothetical protein
MRKPRRALRSSSAPLSSSLAQHGQLVITAQHQAHQRVRCAWYAACGHGQLGALHVLCQG